MKRALLTALVLLAVAAAIYLQREDYALPAGEPEETAKGPEEKKDPEEKTDATGKPPQKTERNEEVSGQSPPQTSRGEEIPILGQKVRLREIRAGGELVNLEFVMRRGILPRRLFAGEGRRILRFDELYRNSVGYGASTVWLLYQLQSGRGVDLAVSRPDGSDFQVLARNLEKVLGFEHLPVENRLRLELREGGSRVVRDYALPSN